MILPEILYQPSEIDFQQLQAQFEIARHQVVSAAATHNERLYIIPNNRVLVLQTLSYMALPGTTQRVRSGGLYAFPQGGGLPNTIIILRVGGGAVDYEVAAMLPSPIILPAGMEIWYESTFSGSTATNLTAVSMSGWLIPRGRLGY